MKNSRIIASLTIAALAAALFYQNQAFAATRAVPSQYPTIAAATRAAQNGDTVLVAPGTYRESVVIDGKYITLQASSTNPSDTVLAGNPGQTLVMIQHVPLQPGLPRARVAGFTITGGYAPDGQGGGITVAYNADPVIEYNDIEYNQALSHGGGILVSFGSNPIIKNNQIRNNTAHTFGGGIFVVQNSNPTITGNQITTNKASGNYSIPNGGSSGGGIYLENTADSSQYSKPTVYNNNISSNTAEFAGGGIMMRVGINSIIQKNTIDSNSAAYGGGVHIETAGSNPVISGNTITNNTAAYNSTFGGSGYGGGISVYASSKPLIEANTISSNKATNGGGGVVMAEGSSSTLRRNIIASNQVTNTTSTYAGGGLYIAGAQANVTNNLIRNNTASLGGGIGLLDGGALTATYNTIASNQSLWTNGAAAGGGGLFVRNQAGVSANVSNNIVSLNKGYQIFEEAPRATLLRNIMTNDNQGLYYNYSSGAITSAANLDASTSVNASGTLDSSPQFIDPLNGNYRPGSGSSAIDSADGTVNNTDDLGYTSRPSGAASDIGAYEYNPTAAKTPIYRFWSDMYRSHFYTSNPDEVAALLQDHTSSEWRYEYIAYGAYDSQQTNTTPLYRFYSPIYKGHFYTADSSEKDSLIANQSATWSYEGVAFYVYPGTYSSTNTTPVYRFWSPSYQHHFYTADSSERDYVSTHYPSSIWTYEGPRYQIPR